MRYLCTWCTAFLLLLVLSLVLLHPRVSVAAQPPDPSTPTPDALQHAALQRQGAFASAAREFAVPEPLLLSVSYNLSRWEAHSGRPSMAGGYGPMHLTQVGLARGFDGRGAEQVRGGGGNLNDPALQTLDTAAQLLGVSPELLKRDPAQNIRGGAALLAHYARETIGTTPADPAAWYAAVARYSGSPVAEVALDFADLVYATMSQGVSRTTSDGQQVILQAQAVVPDVASAAALNLRRSRQTGAECPADLACGFLPAAHQLNDLADLSNYGNYDLAQRPFDGLDIQYIIIHGTEGSYPSVLSYFQDPLAYVSSHYVVRSADGQIMQMVQNNNVAWHAGNWYVNAHAIGIEHESFAIEGATWYSEPMYWASARLVRYLADRYNVPLDRAHIIGSDEVPGPLPRHQPGLHWDPSAFWDWAHFMWLLDAPISAARGPDTSAILTILPTFAANRPAFSYCYDREVADCRAVPSQPANAVYLYSAPDFNAPLVTNPYIDAAPTLANNWANKAVTGQQFYRVERQGDWEAIFFSGQKAWLYNPASNPTVMPGRGTLVTPRAGLASIPVYGRAYPEVESYPEGVLPNDIVPIYTMPAGQVYVAGDLVQSSFYWLTRFAPTLETSARTVVKGQTMYYRIFFNHRFAFVKASDVDVIPSSSVPVRRSW